LWVLTSLLVVEGYEVVCFEMDGEIREELKRFRALESRDGGISRQVE
jgi:hypothetical protein